MPAVSDLEIIFEHHIWATRTLIEHCQTLTPEQLALSMPGTYGAIVPTITHIIAEDQRLLERLTGERAEVSVTEDDTFTLEELLAVWNRQAERWRKVLAQGETLDVTLPARDPWPAVTGARPLVLLEAIQHGNDHRTHVCSVLGANGLPIEFLCGWAFWRSTGRVTPADSLPA
ncbi:DinB family protein [Streptomyces sp. NPDC086549]|uniref:DinB family protein n=1 Tax=Streptomyces sp. NPDC086549 TaxID=3365752 RepID=UPI003824E023